MTVEASSECIGLADLFPDAHKDGNNFYTNAVDSNEESLVVDGKG